MAFARCNQGGAIRLGASYLERVKGIEPSYSAWEAAALPLSYTRVILSGSVEPGFVKPVQHYQFI
jgi:hypothetical protein